MQLFSQFIVGIILFGFLLGHMKHQMKESVLLVAFSLVWYFGLLQNYKAELSMWQHIFSFCKLASAASHL